MMMFLALLSYAKCTLSSKLIYTGNVRWVLATGCLGKDANCKLETYLDAIRV